MPTYYVGTDLHTRTRRPARRRLGGPPGPTLGLYMITGAKSNPVAAMRSSWPAPARWCIRRYPAAAHLLEGGMGLRYIRDSVAGCRISKIALLAALVAGRSSAPGNRSQ